MHTQTRWYVRLMPVVVFAALFFLVLPVWAQDSTAVEAGKQAEESFKTYYQDAPAPPVNKSDAVGKLLGYGVVIGGLVLLLLFIAIGHLSRLTGFKPFAGIKSNATNSRLMLVFLVLGFVGLVYQYNLHGKFVLLGDAASEHGKGLDWMMSITIVVTGIVFVVTQILLFGFAYIYRGRAGRTASYYHDNNKLELWWTIIPAIVLAVLVLFGVEAWNEITAEPKQDALQVELVGHQFQWEIRYAGKDNQLASSDYRLIGADGGLNAIGVNFKEPVAKDDIIQAERVLYLPRGRQVNVNIRAMDVLHGVYMPHFRVQMYAVPGMPTRFAFTPTVTTEEKRQQTGNPEFDFEMACSQLCGSAHYNMRAVIKVVEQAEFDKWMAEQPKAYDAIKAAAVPADAPTPAPATGTTDTKTTAMVSTGKPAASH